MVLRTALMIALLAGLLAPGLPALAEPLEVMSFNVRYGTAKDGENAWPKRCGILVNTLRESDPDCFGVQECLDFQAAYITQKLPEYRWIGVGREKNGGGEMTAIFYKADKLSPLAYASFWLSETPDAPGSRSWKTACSRMASWCYFRDNKTDARFYFLNTHLDHQSAEARKEGAALIARKTAEFDKAAPVIITGDFNAAAEKSAPWQAFSDAGFQDAWVASAEKVGPPITWGAFAPPDEEHSRIDWVLFKGPIKPLRCETVLYNEDGRYPSDHYPVAARFALEP